MLKICVAVFQLDCLFSKTPENRHIGSTKTYMFDNIAKLYDM